MVRMEGLEPPRLSAPDPKSGTATNYATSACDNSLGLWVAPDAKSVRPLAATIPSRLLSGAIGNATSAKRRGKFIDNSEIRNSLSLL